MTTLAAVRDIRLSGPSRLVLATPVIASCTLRKIRKELDQVICLAAPENFVSVGSFYLDFSEVTDEEAKSVLDAIRERVGTVFPYQQK
mmetsp:Transcript_43325/g.70309  ORF Transcript_43325/g.70309 Transcript_43325/m.70309 type:complete len:88 (-) Transcript_43325:486-749(-)